MVWILIAGITGLLLLRLLVTRLEPRMAFYPIAGVQETPAQLSLPYVDLRIPTADGETLHGWWVQHPQPRAQVIFWHGNGGNLSLWLDVIGDLRRRGFSVLAADYRGYGGSSGQASEQGLYRDAEATVDEFNRRWRTTAVPVIYWGRSLGCPVAAYAASRQPPDGLVLETPMPDVRSVLRGNTVLWLLSFVATYRFPTSDFLRRYRGPMLVVHGDRDTIVPFSAGRAVFDDAPSPVKTFLAVPGAGHNDVHFGNPAVYWRAVDEFIATLRASQK